MEDKASNTTTAAKIRALSAEGLSTGDIARQLGIRYQHAYNVLNGKTRPEGSAPRPRTATVPPIEKPPLPITVLIEGGFRHASRWMLSPEGDLTLDLPLTKRLVSMLFVKDGFAVYVGVATMGLAKRLYFYGKPGISQRTSLRLNATLKEELAASGAIDVFKAIPPDLEWNGLPIHGSAGLELGLIKKYALPWNMRSAG